MNEPVHERLEANPGQSTRGAVGFSNDDEEWDEPFDCVASLAAVLAEHGVAAEVGDEWLVLPASGYALMPLLADSVPAGDAIRTLTTIQVHHPTLCPDGVFEYQHSAGAPLEQAITGGLDNWAQMDLVTLLAATQPEPDVCSSLRMEFPATDDRPARARRAVLGPVAHYMSDPPENPSAACPSDDDEEHEFCPCCLLTRSFEAFESLFEEDRFVALRFFAARDEQGEPQADCRVNGEEFEEGAAALREYARTWPAAGYEFRKQYVVLQTVE